MPQIFHRNINYQVKLGIVVIILLVASLAAAASLYYWGPAVTGQGIQKVQPVQFTHSHHVGGLGIDCRYCHFGVEKSSYSQVPPTKVCMNCHSQMYTDALILEPVRESWRTETPVNWIKVHNLSDFVYFNHSAHVNKGIGCAECHGRVDQMPLMYQASTLHMRWCLECHMDPVSHVRPKNEITNMAYKHPSDPSEPVVTNGRVMTDENGTTMTQADLAHKYNLQSKVSCSTCHR